MNNTIQIGLSIEEAFRELNDSECITEKLWYNLELTSNDRYSFWYYGPNNMFKPKSGGLGIKELDDKFRNNGNFSNYFKPNSDVLNEIIKRYKESDKVTIRQIADGHIKGQERLPDDRSKCNILTNLDAALRLEAHATLAASGALESNKNPQSVKSSKDKDYLIHHKNLQETDSELENFILIPLYPQADIINEPKEAKRLASFIHNLFHKSAKNGDRDISIQIPAFTVEKDDQNPYLKESYLIKISLEALN